MTFIPSIQFNDPLLLAGINGQYFIFRPNGEIKQTISIPDQDGANLQVRDVSDNLEFYVFEDISKVYQLKSEPPQDDEEEETFYFQEQSSFTLVPDEGMIEKEGGNTEDHINASMADDEPIDNNI